MEATESDQVDIDNIKNVFVHTKTNVIVEDLDFIDPNKERLLVQQNKN